MTRTHGPTGRFLFDARSATLDRQTGWERYTRELGNALRSQPDVDVWTPSVDGAASRVASDVLKAPSVSRSYEVAHFPTFPPVPWARARKAVVYTVHDLVWWTHPETASRGGRYYYKHLARLAVGRCHLVTPSEVIAAECVAELGVPQENVTAIPLGVSLPSPSPEPPRSRPYLLCVGTVEPRKNLHRLVQAFSVAGLAPDVDLVLVGRSAWGTLPPGVSHLEGVDDAQLATLYRHALTVVQPSIYEGFGLPLAEALNSGARVLCSDIPVFHEVCGPWATYFDPLDVEAMAAALRDAVRVVEDEPPAGRHEWAGQFSWDNAATRLAALYRQLAL